MIGIRLIASSVQLGTIMLIILILQPLLILGLCIFTLRNNSYNMTIRELIASMESSIVLYQYDSDVSDAWDKFQSKFECCGIDGPYDYFGEKDKKNNNYLQKFYYVLKWGINEPNSELSIIIRRHLMLVHLINFLNSQTLTSYRGPQMKQLFPLALFCFSLDFLIFTTNHLGLQHGRSQPKIKGGGGNFLKLIYSAVFNDGKKLEA